MQGAIRNIATLKKWFYANGVPFFTLTYAGQANQIVQRNTAIEDMDDAWSLLETNILGQAEAGRANMHVIVYNKASGANNPIARTNLDIWSNQANQTGNVAGIGSLPVGGVGYIDESKVNGLIAEAKEKWELEKRLEDLEAQISNPNDWTDKLLTGLERIGATPFGQAIAAKFLGLQMPSPGTATIAGTPNSDTDTSGDTFDEDISHTAALLGVDDITLAKKLRKLVQNDPELAKQALLSL